MKRSKKNIERNKLDYLLTDIMPVEVSELFSYSKFYEYLYPSSEFTPADYLHTRKVSYKTHAWSMWKHRPE